MRNLDKYRLFLDLCQEGYFFYQNGNIYRGKVWDNKSKTHKTSETLVLASTLNKAGYRRIKVKGFTLYEHTCVFVLFNGIKELSKHQCIDHLNGLKSDNRIENLECISTRENTKRAESMGNFKRTYGETNGCSELTDKQVLSIRATYSLGGMSQREIAKMHKISQGHVSDIVNGKRWPHLAI